jgi:hypothetical protein
MNDGNGGEDRTTGNGERVPPSVSESPGIDGEVRPVSPGALPKGRRRAPPWNRGSPPAFSAVPADNGESVDDSSAAEGISREINPPGPNA